MVEIDWREVEDVLYGKTRAALHDFAAQHPNEEFSFFAFRADYCYGQIYLCMDTPTNSCQKAKKNYERLRATREKLFGRPGGWDGARYFVARHSDRVLEYTYTSALFQNDAFAQIHFADWEEFFRSNLNDEQYQLENHVIVLFWKVLERLLENRSFGEIKLASPFRTGFEFHDSDLGLVVVQLLNWT